MAALLPLVLALSSGCSGETSNATELPARGLSATEVEWVAGYSAWRDDLFEAGDESEAYRYGPGGPAREAAYREAAEPLLACSRRLADEVGAPPTERLRRLADELEEACQRIEGAARTTAAVVADPSAADRRRGKTALDAGGRAVGAVDTRLGHRLLESSPLPRRAKDGGSWIDPRLTAVARDLTAGRTKEVQCWGAGDWQRLLAEGEAYTNGALTIDSTGAYADYGDGVIALQARDCESLALADDPALAVDDVVWALQVLAHEVEHMAGTEDEALTECYGLQRHADVGRRLGFTTPLARASASSYWEDWYPDQSDEYSSDECRPGGSLDLDPETPSWPTG